MGVVGKPMPEHLLEAGPRVFAMDQRRSPNPDLATKGLQTVTGHDAVARERRRSPTYCSARKVSPMGFLTASS